MKEHYRLTSKILVLCLLVVPLTVFADGKESTSTFTLPSGVEVKIVEAAFSKIMYKVEPCKDKERTGCVINGKHPHGTASTMPKTFLKELTITYKGKSYQLDTSSMFNAWGSRPVEYPGSVRYFGGFCYDENNCAVRGLFADGSATYVAEWVIDGGRPERTVLTESSDVVDLFMKHIDPPKFE